jgi:transposase
MRPHAGARRGRRAETRTFKTTTGSLRVMRDWLIEVGVSIAAMESTSTYWKPPFYCLEEVMEVWLLNAAHMKAVPGRKSDVRDAEWIAQLLEHGLLAPSFVPPPDIRRLRMLTRYREQLMGDRTRELVRLELMLEDASIKLSSVVSSLKTISARAMLTAMIAGEADPLVLADLAKGKLRRKIPDLAQALTGHFDANHARLARSMLRRLDLVEQALAELDAVLLDAFRPWQHQIELLQTIPGVGPKVAQVIIAETGGDMSRFPTAAHLAAWAGLAPAMHESAGRQTPAGKRHGNKWLSGMLVEAAGSVGRMHGKNYLAARHARLLKRRGRGRAQVAVAHSILVAAYWMLKRDEPYHDLGADWHRRRNDEAHTRRLVAQLEHLGHTVIINPAA